MANYKLLYYSNYKSIDNDTLRLEIYKDTSDTITSSEITLDVNPFTVEFPTIKDKLEVIRSSGAELNLICRTSSQFFNLYTAKIKEYKVVFRINGNVIWSGYLDTENYNEEFSLIDNYPIQFTANDGFKILERIKYFQTTDLNPIVKDKAIVSQFEVIKNCITSIGLEFDKLYIGCSTTNNNISIDSNESIFHVTFINPNNFIDEDGVSKNCLEVLEWQLKPYGLFIQKYNNNIYILDYNTILDNLDVKTYSSSFNYINTTKLNFNSGDLVDLKFKGNSSTLSVINSYNKVTIVYSPYIQDTLIDLAIPEDIPNTTFTTVNYTGSSNYSYNKQLYDTYDCFSTTNTNDVTKRGYIVKEIGTGLKNKDEVDYYLQLNVNRTNTQAYDFTDRVLINKPLPFLTSSNNYYLNLTCKLKPIIKGKDYEDSSFDSTILSKFGLIILFVKLTIGNKYYDFFNNQWLTLDASSKPIFQLIFGSMDSNISLAKSWTECTTKSLTTGKSFEGNLYPLDEANGNVNLTFYSDIHVSGCKDSGINGSDGINYISGVMIKDIRLSITDLKGNNVSKSDIEVTGKLFEDFEEEASDINTYQGTNKGIEKDGTDNLNTDIPSALGSLMFKDSNNYYRNMKTWTRSNNIGTIESLLLRTFISNYQYKTLEYDCSCSYVPNQVSYITYNNHLPNKKFIIGGSNINYSDKINKVTLIEISKDLNI